MLNAKLAILAAVPITASIFQSKPSTLGGFFSGFTLYLLRLGLRGFILLNINISYFQNIVKSF
jgi:hypothetical protein